MARFISELPYIKQEQIRIRATSYLENIEPGLSNKKDDFGVTNIENIMNDTINNLENMREVY